MKFRLRQLRAFVLVAEQGSFTAAARVLNLAQPAVSTVIRDLEIRLGTPLFDRTTRQVELTAAGAILLEGARRALAELDGTAARIDDLVARRSGRVAVGAPPLLSVVWLPDLLTTFRAHFPGIAISLIDAPTDRLIAALQTGEIDLAVGTFPAGADLVLEEVAADHLVALVPEGHALAALEAVPWTALDGVPLIALSTASGVRALVDRSARQAGVTLTLSLEVAQMATAVALVTAGFGISVLPSYAVRLEGRVQARPMRDPAVRRPIQMARPTGRSDTPAAAAFIDLITRRKTSSSGPALCEHM